MVNGCKGIACSPEKALIIVLVTIFNIIGKKPCGQRQNRTADLLFFRQRLTIKPFLILH